MLVAITHLRVPEGVASKMRVCISEGRLEYAGKMTSSGILLSLPSAFIRSCRICAAVSTSSWMFSPSQLFVV